MITGVRHGSLLLVVLVAAALAACGGSGRRAAPEPAAGQDRLIALDLSFHTAYRPIALDLRRAVELVLRHAGDRAGTYGVRLRLEDTDRPGGDAAWDTPSCVLNARAHVRATAEVVVIGPRGTGCAKVETPILNRAPDGPLPMVGYVGGNPGLIARWNPGEPGRWYPTGIRSFGHVVASDPYQGTAAARLAHAGLGRSRCLVLDDGGVYGRALAAAFRAEAVRLGLTVVRSATWDARARGYRALFHRARALGTDCVYLAGSNDSNGLRVLRDKVRFLGSNTRVAVIAPDGFSGYPEVRAAGAARGVYLTLAGLPLAALEERSPVVRAFVEEFVTTYGHRPASGEALYGAAAAQLVLAAIGASDGSRRGVRDRLFSGITIPAASSVIGEDVGIDHRNGESVSKVLAVYRITGGSEMYDHAIDLRQGGTSG
jgi:branched-chain amino acid transport system substrate-binding protein